MKLSTKQQEFTLAIGKLINYANSLGYGLTFGDAYRSPKVKYGHKNSTHRSRLAVDFNLFIGDEYLIGEDAQLAHNVLHDYWDNIGGSKRIKRDLNHYSFKYKGIR